jgi:hypothetical protein
VLALASCGGGDKAATACDRAGDDVVAVVKTRLASQAGISDVHAVRDEKGNVYISAAVDGVVEGTVATWVVTSVDPPVVYSVEKNAEWMSDHPRADEEHVAFDGKAVQRSRACVFGLSPDVRIR